MKLRQYRYITLFIFLAVMIPPGARAELDWGAKYAGDYLSGQSNARLLALGGAGVAIAEGPSAVLANPARLFLAYPNAVSLMHIDRFESAVKVDHASYVINGGGDRAIGFGFIRQGVDDIPVTVLEDPGRPIGQDNRVRVIDRTGAAEYALQFAYAANRRQGMFGVNAKLLYKRLYHYDGLGFGFDVGYSRSFGGLTVGAQVRDVLGTIIVWETGRQEVIVPTGRFGVAYALHVERLRADILPTVEIRLRSESFDDPDFMTLHAGFEYLIQGVVAARIGWDDSSLTYGAGLAVGPVRFDYAFMGHEDLGATHRISLGYRWGKRP